MIQREPIIALFSLHEFHSSGTISGQKWKLFKNSFCLAHRRLGAHRALPLFPVGGAAKRG